MILAYESSNKIRSNAILSVIVNIFLFSSFFRYLRLDCYTFEWSNSKKTFLDVEKKAQTEVNREKETSSEHMCSTAVKLENEVPLISKRI